MRRAIIFGMMLLFLALPALSAELEPVELPLPNDEKAIVDVTIATFENYTKLYTSDEGIKFSTEKVTFYDLGDKLKFDIDYTGTKPDAEGWHWHTITTSIPIRKEYGIRWNVDNRMMDFTWFYNHNECTPIYYKGEAVEEDCTGADKVRLRQVDDYNLEVGWKPENISDMIYDPVVSDFNESNMTAWYKLQENSMTTAKDSAGNPSNHDCDNDQTNNITYGEGLYVGDYRAIFTPDARLDCNNPGDFDGGSMMELNFVAMLNYTRTKGRAVDFEEVNFDFEDVGDGGPEVGFTVDTDGSDGSGSPYWHDDVLSTGEIYNFSLVYNGTTCRHYKDGTLIYTDTSCTGNIVEITKVYIGMGNTGPYNGSIYCLGYWANANLDDSARQDFFDYCWEGEPTAGAEDNNRTVTSYYNTTVNQSFIGVFCQANDTPTNFTHYRVESCASPTIQDTVSDDVSALNSTSNFTGLNASTTYHIICEANYNDRAFANSSCLNVTTTATPSSPENVSGPVLNLTFDNESQSWRDYSELNHTVEAQGNANFTNSTYAKWYGGLNLTATSGDYLNFSTDWTSMDGITIAYWHKTPTLASGGNSYYYFMYDTDLNSPYHWYASDQGGGPQVNFHANTGQTSYTEGSVFGADQWYHTVIVYNESHGLIYRNGVLTTNESEPYGSLNYTAGEQFQIGAGHYGIDYIGIMDEVLIYNVSNFTSADIQAWYDDKRLGTPPSMDLYAGVFNYTLPFNYSWNVTGDYTHLPEPGDDLEITIQLANWGTEDSDDFTSRLYIDEVEVCNITLNLTGQSNYNWTCNWTTSWGWHVGNLTVDSEDDVTEEHEDNNILRVDIPYVNPPYMLNITEWWDEIEPYARNSSNKGAYDAIEWWDGFGCSAFASSTCEDVDPYGTKAFECAFVCLINNYTAGNTACERARDHLSNWTAMDTEDCSSVQALHYWGWVGMAFDIMRPSLNQSETEYYADRLHAFGQRIYNLYNVRPDTDNNSWYSFDNGLGFSQGMGQLTHNIIGVYDENPAMWQENDQSSYPISSMTESWINRLDSLMHYGKNNTWSHYPEGPDYQRYAFFNVYPVMYLLDKYSLVDTSEYYQTFCMIGKEFVTDYLTYKYNGNTLRGDSNRNFSQISWGDSTNFENPGGTTGFLDWSVMAYASSFCNETYTKEAVKYLLNLAYDIDETEVRTSLFNIWMWKEANDGIDDVSSLIDEFPGTIVDIQNDQIRFRNNYSYYEDSMLWIDTGESEMGGHPTAQGHFYHYKGENAIDIIQVPYNDDVRDEKWMNGMSFDTADGGYSRTCGYAPLNQYYGNDDNCNEFSLPDDWPDYRNHNITYGGGLYDAMGTADGKWGGVLVTRPYENISEDVREYYVKVLNNVFIWTVVKGSNMTNATRNFISIEEDWNKTYDGLNFTLSRNGVNVNVTKVYSDQSAIPYADNTTRYSFAKTSYGGATGNYTRITWTATTSNWSLITSYNGFEDGNLEETVPINSSDKGASWGSYYVLFDEDRNGMVNYSGITTDGWAIAYNNNTREYATWNATSLTVGSTNLLSSDLPGSYHINVSASEIVLTASTLEYDTSTLKPQTIEVTINASQLDNNTNLSVTLDGVNITSVDSGTMISFNITPSQNGDEYIVTGGNPAPPEYENGTGNYTLEPVWFSYADTAVLEDEVYSNNASTNNCSVSATAYDGNSLLCANGWNANAVIDRTAEFNLTGNWTYASWILCGATNTQIFHETEGLLNPTEFIIQTDTSAIEVGNASTNVQTDDTYCNSAWQYLVITANSTDINVTINGTAVASTATGAYDGYTHSNSAFYQLGHYNNKGTVYLDNIAVFADALNMDDIRDLFESGGDPFNTTLSFSAHNARTNASLSEFFVTVTNGTHIYEYNATAGLAVFNITEGSWTYIIEADGFADSTGNTTAPNNLDVAMYETSTVTITIYSAENMSLLTENVTIYAIGNITSFVNYTSTGSTTIQFIIPDDYELRFSAEDFNTISAFVTVTNESTESITVYMTSNASTELQVVEVVDTANQPVEGAIVWLEKEIVAGPTQFIKIQEAQTDYNGITAVWVERDTSVYYRFAVIYEGTARPIQPSGNLYTGKTFFIPGVEETIQLIINLESTPTDFITTRYGVLFNVTYGGAGNHTVIFTFLDGDNSIDGGRLYVEGKYLNVSSSYSVMSNEFLSATSGQLNYTFPITNNTIYKVQAFIDYGDAEELVYEGLVPYEGDGSLDKQLGILYAVAVLLTVALLTVTMGALVSSIFTFGSLLILSFMHFVAIPTAIITSLIAFAVIVFVKAKERSQ